MLAVFVRNVAIIDRNILLQDQSTSICGMDIKHGNQGKRAFTAVSKKGHLANQGKGDFTGVSAKVI